MELSKRIPARTKTVKFKQCVKSFLEMTPSYRKVRSCFRDPLDTCFWCGHKLENGEIIALAIPERGRNKALCQDCADELLASDKPPR